MEIVKICEKHGSLTERNKFGRCRLCKNEGARRYRQTEKGKSAEKRNMAAKRSRKEYMEKRAIAAKERDQRDIDNLHKTYVKQLLKKCGFENEIITEEIIDLKRAIVKIDRMKKENANN